MMTTLCLSLYQDADRLMTQYPAHLSIFRTTPTLFTTRTIQPTHHPSLDVTFSISVTQPRVTLRVTCHAGRHWPHGRDTMEMHCDVKMVSLKRVTVMKFLFKFRGEKQGIMD